MNHIGSTISNTSPGWGPGNVNQNTFLTGPFIGTDQGVAANIAIRWRWVNAVGPSYMTAVNSDATGYKNLYTADSTDSNSGQPAAANVRSGTIYGPNSELTGTCAVPAAGSVAFGVPVDATTGTAVLTPESVRSAIGLASANLDTQLDALPTAAENATAVWAAATRTITGGTVDTLTNAPDVPTEAEIAAEVWSATTREITGGTVDTLTNSPDVPTEAEIASAVRDELEPELARVSNAATTQEVADIIEGALEPPAT
jgi:hypothetical protein